MWALHQIGHLEREEQGNNSSYLQLSEALCQAGRGSGCLGLHEEHSGADLGPEDLVAALSTDWGATPMTDKYMIGCSVTLLASFCLFHYQLSFCPTGPE